MPLGGPPGSDGTQPPPIRREQGLTWRAKPLIPGSVSWSTWQLGDTCPSGQNKEQVGILDAASGRLTYLVALHKRPEEFY